ncbi:MAG: myo-inositol 2-dehydrogenase/D-chiro-inositol 1-dehydrogenase [Candidatus Aldehydirespiratoraceae bacterium]|jgi:myo-inositol 2-dehydrogenase/D-chiro-inositol 1-dehydrogenase
MAEEIRYGVIGTGMMGVEHISNILALDNCAVTAVADPHPASLDWAQVAVGLDTPLAKFTNTEELIGSGLCDALVVASPNFTHHEVLLPAIESGLHLLVEKPLCTTLADCREVLDLAGKRHADTGEHQVIWMGLEYRYMPPVQRVMAEIKAGVVGDVKMVAIREHRFPFLVKVGNWNRFSKNSGGTLVEKCCHFFDLMMQATQSRPVRVVASGAQDVNHLDEVYDGERSDILDNAYVIVEFENGSRGMLDLCMFAEASKNEREISVVGHRGKLEALDTESVVRIGRRTDDIVSGINVVVEEQITDARIKHQGLHHGASYLEHVDFAEAIRSGRPASVTLLDGLWSAAVGFAAHRSLDTGLPVLIDDLPEMQGLEFTP